MEPLCGRSVRRLEDERFLTGRGRYTDDVTVPGQAIAQIVRSIHAHAKILRIDTDAAQAAPGVLGVFVASDLAADGVGPIPCTVQVATVEPMRVPKRFALAHDRVRHVGEPVAFVVANTSEQARDAAELVTVDYDVLPCVVDARAAAAPGAARLWDDIPENISYWFEKGDRAAVQAAVAGAAHVVELELVNNRIIVAQIAHPEAPPQIGDQYNTTGQYHDEAARLQQERESLTAERAHPKTLIRDPQGNIIGVQGHPGQPPKAVQRDHTGRVVGLR